MAEVTCNIGNCYKQLYQRDLCLFHYENRLSIERKSKDKHSKLNNKRALDFYHNRKNDPGWQDKRRDANLRRDFGITSFDYDNIVENQGGVCAICKQPEIATRNGKVKRLAVDHCHDTGIVRGLLCQLCNTMIGNAKDDTDRLLAAIEYLTSRRC